MGAPTEADIRGAIIERRTADRPVVILVGEDGNAFSILGRARQALRLAGRGDECEEFTEQATSGDYDHLLATVMNWFVVR